MNVDTLIDRLITLREHALPGTALVKASQVIVAPTEAK